MARKQECIAMLLAGGQGSRLGILTKNIAKPAVPYGGKYRIIDFPLSNCVNSGISTVGVLTQYQPLELNDYIGNGQAWDLDRANGGVHILSPYQQIKGTEWYKGTANAIYQNINFIDRYDPEYVVILSGDHIYKMDYNKVLEYHIAKKADITVVCKDFSDDVSVERFGCVKTDEDGRIREFEEKPVKATSHTISCGIYVIRRRLLIELIEKSAEEGRHDLVADILIRYKGMKRIFGYKMKDYWKNIASVEDYYETNMDFLKPDVRNYFFREYPAVYSKVDDLAPAKYNVGSDVKNSLVSSGSIINGKVENSIIFKKVFVGNNCTIKNSIILNDVYIGDNTHIENCIVESRDTIKANSRFVGEGEIKIVVERNERYVI